MATSSHSVQQIANTHKVIVVKRATITTVVLVIKIEFSIFKTDNISDRE